MVLLELRTTRSCPAQHSPRGRLNGESRRHPSPCQASPATEHTAQILSFGTRYAQPQQRGDHSTFRPNQSKPREGIVAIKHSANALVSICTSREDRGVICPSVR